MTFDQGLATSLAYQQQLRDVPSLSNSPVNSYNPDTSLVMCSLWHVLESTAWHLRRYRQYLTLQSLWAPKTVSTLLKTVSTLSLPFTHCGNALSNITRSMGIFFQISYELPRVKRAQNPVENQKSQRLSFSEILLEFCSILVKVYKNLDFTEFHSIL